MNIFRINATTVAVDGVVYVTANVRASKYKVNAKDSISAIMRLIERKGPMTHGVILNRVRYMEGAEQSLSDLVAVGRLCMSVSVHHYTNQEIKTYSLPPKS